VSNKKKYLLLIISLLIVLSIGIAGYMVIRPSLIYPYDVKRDYVYNFHQSDAEKEDFILKGHRVAVPAVDKSISAAFLKLSINTTFMGAYLQPSVTASTGKDAVVQYFEHGAEGVRYLNVSSLLSDKENIIDLKGRHVQIEDQSVQLILFRNKGTENARILVLAPHPDDAEIAAYGLYSSNKDSFIVTITAGDGGPKNYNELYWNNEQHYLKKGELRTWNSIVVPLLGGISPENVLNLGFFDWTLKAMFEEGSAEVKAHRTNISDIDTYRRLNISSLAEGLHGKSDWPSLVSNLVYIMDKVAPDIIVAPFPALDIHPDHKYSTIALIEAIRKTGRKDGQLYLYTNHLVLNEMYPYGETGGVVSLPPSFTDAGYPVTVYSHPLSSNRQKEKILALDAMNDLRPDTEWRFYKGIVKMAMSKAKSDFLGEDISYFRRAVRNNELFFVIDVGEIYKDDVVSQLLGDIDAVTNIYGE